MLIASNGSWTTKEHLVYSTVLRKGFIINVLRDLPTRNNAYTKYFHKVVLLHWL